MAAKITPGRSQHLGSFLRPQRLADARRDWRAGIIDIAQLRVIEDEEIKKFVDRQREIGLQTYTDGEFRREFFWAGVWDNIDGMTQIATPREKFKLYMPGSVHLLRQSEAPLMWIATGRISRARPMFLDAFLYVKSIIPPEEVPRIKVTMSGLCETLLKLGPNAYNNDIYHSEEEFIHDLATIYREEIKGLYDAGCRNIQLDDPWLLQLGYQPIQDDIVTVGEDPERLFQLMRLLLLECLRDRPSDMIIGIHMCRGNMKGKNFIGGGYNWISPKLFKDLPVDCLCLEYDTDNSPVPATWVGTETGTGRP